MKKKGFKVKPDGSKAPYEEKKKKKNPKINHCDVFKNTSDHLGSRRTQLGIPPNTKIAVDMKLTDMNNICLNKEKVPKAIIQRLGS